MDSQQLQYKSSSNKNVRSSQIFYNIADDDMNDFFLQVVEEEGERQERLRQTIDEQDLDPEPEYVQLQKDQQKEIVSRLEIEIEKNGLNFVPVYGEIFIMLFKCQLIGESKIDNGIMLVTNYRLVFFKKKKKKVDLPFGFINTVKQIDKNGQLHVFLKYHHFWKFQVKDKAKYEQVKIFLQLYLKFDHPSSCFALNYALKFPQQFKYKQQHPAVLKQYQNLGIDKSVDFMKILNREFTICETYPQYIFVPLSKSLGNMLMTIANKWNGCRVPIACYIHRSISKSSIVLWRSSYVVADRADKLTEVAKYLHKIKGKCEKLMVFDTGSKNTKKCVEQFQINSVCEMYYLQLEPLSALKTSYEEIIKCFLSDKKAFIRDVIASKWYDMIVQVLKAASRVKNSLIMQNNTLLKCSDGRQRSAQISALAQIILNPYYRTFSGFAVLIEKQFKYLGYPFTTRFGFRSQKDQQIPLFVQFLDCVSQLLHANQMSFQFNFKYLSKLSNLMYTCLFGTFITNSQKQWTTHNLQTDTIPIWNELVNDLTTNAFYQNKHGDLQVPDTMNDIRVWRQHFWYLTTPPKQTYRLHPLAEDNHDYINLGCLRYLRQNQKLQIQVNRQRKQMQELKSKIELLQKQKQ